MDLWMLTEETLESDTKMIWGGPIFSVSGEGGDEYGDEHDELEGITCVIPRISLARSLMPMQQLSTLVDIRNSTHLRT